MGRGDDAYRSLSLGPDVSEEVNRIDSIEAREFFKSSQNTFLQEEKMEVCQRTQTTGEVMLLSSLTRQYTLIIFAAYSSHYPV